MPNHPAGPFGSSNRSSSEEGSMLDEIPLDQAARSSRGRTAAAFIARELNLLAVPGDF